MPEAATDLCFAGVAEQARLFRSGGLSPVELVRAQLARIERLDPTLRAFITVRADAALREARVAEDEIRSGRARSMLHGVTVGVKDQMLVEGVRLTGGSRVIDLVADRDATAVARLRSAGAIVLGTLNTHEFHAGPTRVFPFGTPRNPWNLDHTPGGSSSGSGSAVAAGLCTVSMGGDTGGSIRGPAAMCGIVGLKPTWSRISRDGVIPLAPSLDVIGPLARRVEDVALVLEIVAGPDPRDPTASHAPVPAYAAHAPGDLRGLRVGVIDELMGPAGPSAEPIAAVRAAIDVLVELGATVEPVGIPLVPHALELMWALVVGEAAGYHRPWLRTRYEDYDTNTRTRLVGGAIMPTGVYTDAQRLRARLARQVRAALERFDVLVSPTGEAAPRLADPQGAAAPQDAAAPPPVGPSARASSPTYQAFNLSGHPALTVPCGFDRAGLPLGLQIVGRHFDERTILGVGRTYERAAPWHQRRPPVAA
jgi:aspartyl-tRNA(Asn)/glutamyl-tRNA(Gln) amidotransferase subunit A